MESSKLNEKFETPYLRELSIQDHCREVNQLYDMRRKAKAVKNDDYRGHLEEAIANESVDLMLILLRHFGEDTERIEKRRAKFIEKERGRHGRKAVTEKVPYDLTDPNDRDALRGKWLYKMEHSRKNDLSEVVVTGFQCCGNNQWYALTSVGDLTADQLFRSYVFLDGPDKGEPVGKVAYDD